jgi:hypothetical protein
VALMALAIAAPVGWWMVRSYRINQGDLFYFNPVVEGHRIVQNPYFDYTFLAHAADYYRSVWGGIFVTWWAHFGWLDTPVAPWMYTILRALTILALAGLLVLAFRLRRQRPALLWPRLAPWILMALAIILPIVLLQYYDLSFWRAYGLGRGLQGRYWLGTVVPMLLFFTVGLLALLPARCRPAGHISLRLGMILLNFASLLGFVLPRFYL